MQIMGNFSGLAYPFVISLNKVAKKIALSIASAIARVSPANVLQTTLLILFDCHVRGQKHPSFPIIVTKCPP